MSCERELNRIKTVIKKNLPADIKIKKIEFEGPDIAVYSENPKVLIDDANILKDLAKKMRKRIVVR